MGYLKIRQGKQSEDHRLRRLERATSLFWVFTLTTKADSISGGSNIDTITAGLGADTITGGYGNDLILLSETTASVDVLKYAEYGTANVDAVLGATAASDVISISVGNLTPSSGGTAYTLATTSGLDRSAAIVT